ncbi:MAG TPA: arylsulfotransferase family protein, partial [Thermoleophilaceae bacterium]|nr:arylsulfotransferase family protein [Thermoleophilaceae bacterium]
VDGDHPRELAQVDVVKKAAFKLQPVLELRRTQERAAAVAAAQAPGALAADVEASPALKPAFRTSIPDYTVRCRDGERVRLEIEPPDGEPFTRSVDLAPGRAAAVRLRFAEGTRRYRIRCLPEDFPNWRTHRYGTPQAGWYLVTPNKSEGAGYAAIFDSHGVPVWWIRRTPAPFAADLLPNGNLVWTNYVALSPVSDRFVEWTLAGRRKRSFGTVGPSTNQHDFQLLPNGNALMLTYPARDHVDLRAFGGPADATVLDGEIQEVDPTGKLVWRWSSRDHVKLAEADRWIRNQIAHPVIRKFDGTPVYDLVHINALEPNGSRLLFSARYLDAAYAIDRRSGAIRWKLGGTRTPRSLTIADDPLAKVDFGGPHDVRQPRPGLVTIYDNGALRDRDPRALAFRLDLAGRRAELVRDVRFPRVGRSVCCGSARLLPERNWVVSWGNTPWVTEQTWGGEPVLAIEFRPADDELASYRAVPVMPGTLTRDRLHTAMRAMYGG